MRRRGTQCSQACEGAPAPGFKTWEEEIASQGQGGALPGSEEEGKLPTSLLSGQWDWNRVDETGIVTQPFQCLSRHWGSEGPVSPEGTSAPPRAAYPAVGAVLVQVFAHSAQLGVRQNLAWLPSQSLRVFLCLLQCPKTVVTGWGREPGMTCVSEQGLHLSFHSNSHRARTAPGSQQMF